MNSFTSQDNNLVNLQEEYKNRQIQEVLDELERDLVGLKPVKDRIKEIAALLLVHRLRKLLGLTSANPNLHMSFTGRPGTGKTSVATKIGLVLRNLGYLTKGHITNVTREDLVGQYVGHTAPKTKEQLNRARGGILFMDEAQHLYKPDNERDYGSEAIELLLQVMENQRDDLILVFSGPKKKIDGFFNSNPGISSRIGNHVDFIDYKVPDLMAITKFLLHNDYRYKFDEKTIEVLEFYISQLVSFDTFANVRTIKILLNQLLSYQSIRVETELTQKGSLQYDSLVTVKKEDFLFTQDDFINIIGSENIKLHS